ncbi:hypothetical protein SUGI_0797740 [Cryptomeria japonica]|uniref:uncharacterized protein LOC131038796 n=1 Tax=Cryptomeria japonica TaxID=3369 RepID=UPI00241496C8|nr:uncharacterized protein LOC131038796 [Cryptomeria japonica]GLJ39142.1 hypothetical protein SUGI_0797740 [Cryptomeria japonica]
MERKGNHCCVTFRWERKRFNIAVRKVIEKLSAIVPVTKSIGLKNSEHRSELEHSIWSEMPMHIVEKILQFLPVDSMYSLRTVSKELNALLPYSSSFLAFRIYHNDYMAYSFLTGKWKTLSLTFQPRFLERDIFKVEGSGRGLLLLNHLITRKLYICNPLNGSYSELDQILIMKERYMAAILDGEARNSYEIVTVSCKNIEVYDSSKKSIWVVDKIPAGYYLLERVWYNGSLVLGLGKKNPPSNRTGESYIVFYRIWDSMPIVLVPLPVQNYRYFRLVACRSYLIVVEAIAGNPTSVVLWEFDRNPSSPLSFWKEIARVSRFIGVEITTILSSCVGVGDFICFKCFKFHRVLVYDVKLRSWNFLPESPFELKYAYYLISFEPRFDLIL